MVAHVKCYEAIPMKMHNAEQWTCKAACYQQKLDLLVFQCIFDDFSVQVFGKDNIAAENKLHTVVKVQMTKIYIPVSSLQI